MKVFGISCGRKNGNSEILLKQALMAIEEKCGARTNFIRLQDANIKPCTGCETCMVNHIRGNSDFRCIHRKEDDHFYFIENQMREAEAIIVSAPVYNLMPPGILITFLNKLHASGDYREVIHRKPKMGAVISVGGTDWTNLGTPINRLVISSLCGGHGPIVDQLDVQFHPSSGSVLMDDETMSRAYVLGENVASALTGEKKSGVFMGGDAVCPGCHGNLLEYRKGDLYCPMCEAKAEYSIESGKLHIQFTEDSINHNRWNPWGAELHMSNIAKGHKKASDNSETINMRRKVYSEFKKPMELPELSKQSEI